MARKTKEELNKKDEKIIKKSTAKTTKKTKTAAASKSAVKNAVKKEPIKKLTSTSKKEPTKKVTTPKKEAPKKVVDTTKKDSAKKVASTSKKEATKKVVDTTKKESAKKIASTSKKEPTKKVATPKKEATKKVVDTTKIDPIKKVANASKKKTTKKVVSKESKTKTAAKKSTTTTKKRSTTKKSVTKTKVISLNPIEYYDLPYRYNETVVKVLAQNPNTLFVYWDISDNDRENLEKQYGKLFFYNTRPVLVIHNLTDNYTFEIDIDDFANNWYVNVNDTKCKYFVELGRRPKYENHDAIPVNYLNVASSNIIEMPNDHILFFKDNDKIYFKNIKTNRVTEKIFKSKTYSSKLKGIYSNYNLSEKDDRFDFKNPSSQNPTSNVL